MSLPIVIQHPPGARHLMLLFHGVGAAAEHLVALGRHLAADSPETCVVSVGAPEPADRGTGWQWFSIRDMTDAVREERVDDAMPGFSAAVLEWQRRARVGPDETTLIGFSQGGIMALESLRCAHVAASRIVSIAGRLARAPVMAARAVEVHLFHGALDRVIACHHSVTAERQLTELGYPVSLDVIAGLDHDLNRELMDKLAARLRLQANAGS